MAKTRINYDMVMYVDDRFAGPAPVDMEAILERHIPGIRTTITWGACSRRDCIHVAHSAYRGRCWKHGQEPRLLECGRCGLVLVRLSDPPNAEGFEGSDKEIGVVLCAFCSNQPDAIAGIK